MPEFSDSSAYIASKASTLKAISANAIDQPRASLSTYTHYLDRHVCGIRDYHAQFKAGRDIDLDVGSSVPIDRRVAAFRYTSKAQAGEYFQHIQDKIACIVDDGNQSELVDLVGQYQCSYDIVDVATQELRELRQMTNEQHQMIDDLRLTIKSASDACVKIDLIRELEDELTRHKRFLEESALCIQLMADELAMTYKELQSLRSKLSALPDLKAHIQELESDMCATDTVAHYLKEEVVGLKAALVAPKDKHAPGEPTSPETPINNAAV
ncbi:hypothetical protein [Marinagarivorans algicola]|uniref:hypothetical protein n=1 Tax=Marinagarivorans algicola TaxID=1513270 RepID=UPI0006B586EA|nr:hypothetical protein [Marinagarivorans algicola]